MRICFVSPIGPEHPGNGLAHRARQWLDTLRSLGEVTVVVVPISGPYYTGADSIRVPAVSPAANSPLPRLASAVSAHAAAAVHDAAGSFDVVVAFRSYVAPLAVALCSPSSRLIIDFDDDDAAVADAAGDVAEARRWRTLNDWVAPFAQVLVSATAGMLDEPPLLGHPRRVLLPNCVAVADQPLRRGTGSVLVMVGNFDYQPNAQGAGWFVDQVVPLLTAVRPDVDVRFAGRGSERLPTGGLGFVADLSSLYAAADVALVPIHRGSGSCIKALEAWAHGVPVVGTTIGVRGIGAVDAVNAMICDEPEAMAGAILALLGDPALAARIGEAGRQQVVAAYSPATSAAIIGAAVEQCSGGPHQPDRLRLGHHLTITEVADGLAIHDPLLDTVHHLDPVASIVATLVDGTRTNAEVVSDAAQVIGQPDRGVSMASVALEALVERHLVVVDYDSVADPSAAALVR